MLEGSHFLRKDEGCFVMHDQILVCTYKLRCVCDHKVVPLELRQLVRSVQWWKIQWLQHCWKRALLRLLPYQRFLLATCQWYCQQLDLTFASRRCPSQTSSATPFYLPFGTMYATIPSKAFLALDASGLLSSNKASAVAGCFRAGVRGAAWDTVGVPPEWRQHTSRPSCGRGDVWRCNNSIAVWQRH
jgi:hypothetical protein